MANILNAGPIVPISKGTYDSTVTYSILNLVDDGSGRLYLSKKNNNLGNNLSNETWWGRYTGKSAYEVAVENGYEGTEEQWLVNLKGDTGATGPQGPQGIKGDTGSSGFSGAAEDLEVVQTTGTSETAVMSQNATTKAINAQTGYYVCNTAAGDATKIVTVESGNLYTLMTGGEIKVKMIYSNTATSNVTLKIGEASAINLYYNGAVVSATNTWEDGEIMSVFYDGTNYQASNIISKFNTGEIVRNIGIDSEPTAGSENLVKSGGVSELLFNNFFTGKGSTLVSTRIYGLSAGYKYKIILKDNEWDKSETTSTSVNCFAITNVYNDTATNLVSYNIAQTPKKEIQITIPENSDYIEVKGRANNGVKVSFQIEGYDYNKERLSEIAYVSLTSTPRHNLQIEENRGSGNSVYIYSNYWVFNNASNAKVTYSNNAAFAQALGVSLVTSPMGVADCIEIPNDHSLVYNCKSNTFSIISINSIDEFCIQFVACHNGFITHISHGLGLSYVKSYVDEKTPLYTVSRDSKTSDLTINSRYITPEGILASSSNWQCFVYNNITEAKYYYSTFMNNNGVQKAVYVVLNKVVASEADINTNTIINVGPLYGQWDKVSEPTDTTFRGYVDGVIEVGASAKSIVILCVKSSTYSINFEKVGLFTEANFTNMKHFFEKDNKSTLLFNIGDRASLGELSGNTSIYVTGKAATPIIVTSYAKYTTESENYPSIQMTCGNYTSISYKIGRKEGYVYQQWRIPPIIANMVCATINLTVPSGVVLNISDFSVQNESVSVHDNTGIRLDSHLGLQYYAPQNTEMAFLMAAVCGYKACITNPMVTSDGEFICYHNNNSTLNVIGTTEKVSLTSEQVHEMTYNELVSTYEVSNDYFTEKIPKLEDFFRICAQTGMKPMFSVHPELTIEQWQEVRTMLIRYGLLGSLRIKTNVFDSLGNAYTVLGEDIEGYMYYKSGSPNISSICTSFDNTVPAGNIVRIVEFQTNYFTQSDVDYALAHGFLCSVWDVYGHLTGEQYKEYVSMGISGFTDDRNCCSGLMW